MLTPRVLLQIVLFAPVLILIELACAAAECCGYVFDRD